MQWCQIVTFASLQRHPGITCIFNFWHSGTLALRVPECQKLKTWMAKCIISWHLCPLKGNWADIWYSEEELGRIGIPLTPSPCCRLLNVTTHPSRAIAPLSSVIRHKCTRRLLKQAFVCLLVVVAIYYVISSARINWHFLYDKMEENLIFLSA